MATISGYDSSSLGVLFSSLNNKSGSGTTDLLGINYTDYATIRSGSYFKLLKSYYSIDSSDEVKKIVNNDKDEDEKKTDSKKEWGSPSTSTSTSTSKDSAETISKVESSANELGKATDTLLSTGKSAVFKATEEKDDAGNVTEKYDTDKIYKAVNDFVTDYNAVMDNALSAKSANIVGAAERMGRITGYNEESLGKIGITVEENGKLKIDEKAFKAADMADVKRVFNNENGYVSQVDTQASMIAYYAENEASKSNTYSNTGTYTNTYNTGSMYSEGI
ncbi:MAG: hypothetical protein IKL06_01120 [Lachnospiraceae bacterium]|nr:hypothetical protein [Lachnospiraceae bacterium]